MKIFYKTQARISGKMALAGREETTLHYLGIAVCGAKKKVNTLTGSMALLR